MTTSRELPWYREPWPWILMSGPAIVVVAGIATAAIAWKYNDALVADDYYKQGLAINREIKRDEAAQRLGIVALLSFSTDRSQVRVRLDGAPASVAGLKLLLVHPTREGMDQQVSLRPIAAGMFEGRLQPPVGEAWQIQLLDAGGVWRLAGTWSIRSEMLSMGVKVSQ
jgi:hypothetical protein